MKITSTSTVAILSNIFTKASPNPSRSKPERMFASKIPVLLSLLLLSSSAFAERLPLDDPWITFCLKTQPVEKVGACIDGLPSENRKLIAAEGYEMRSTVKLELVPLGTTRPAQSTFICPHEFGSACKYLVDAVLALNGSCKTEINNTVCHLP